MSEKGKWQMNNEDIERFWSRVEIGGAMNELPRVARLLLVGLVLLALYAVVFQWVRLPLLRSKGR